MPKSVDLEEKYINNIKVDKENDDVFFNDETHTYYDKETMETYVSCTTLIHAYTQEFNEEFWASYKALEALLSEEAFAPLKRVLLSTKRFDPRIIKRMKLDENEFSSKVEEIKAEYKRKRDESCSRGTLIHYEKEMSFYGRNKFDFGKYGFKDLVGDFECRKDYYHLDLENGVYPEYLISLKSRDGLLRVSGQSDLVIRQGNDLYIIDWKSNAKIDKTSYYDRSKKSHVMMKFPLNHLQDCNFNVYSLQLSLYAYMLQQIYPELVVKGLKLVHIDHDNNQHEYDCEYLKEDVEKMLKHYKKQLKIKQELDNLKPVIK